MRRTRPLGEIGSGIHLGQLIEQVRKSGHLQLHLGSAAQLHKSDLPLVVHRDTCNVFQRNRARFLQRIRKFAGL
jgi:hypothetical protein